MPTDIWEAASGSAVLGQMPVRAFELKDYTRGNTGDTIINAYFIGVHERNPTYPYQSHLHQRSSTYERSPASLI